MEAASVNFHSPGDEILVVDGGKFGERFWRIARAYGLKTQVLKIDYGEAVSPAAVVEAVARNPHLRSVCVALCETSTGVVYDIEEIAKRLTRKGPLLIVDAISGLAADRFEMDAWGVDIAVSGSQKGLMLPPGLSFLAVGARASERMKGAKLPRFYFDLSLYEKAMDDWDSPFTPAISLVVALREALRSIEKEGLEKVLRRTERLALYTRQQMAQFGFELFAKRPSNGVTAVRVPKGYDGERLIQWIRDKKGVTLAGGQGEMRGQIIRMAHMGFIRKKDIDRGLQSLKLALRDIGKSEQRQAVLARGKDQ
jgi:aspartate aminotransferase-like enzyme